MFSFGSPFHSFTGKNKVLLHTWKLDTTWKIPSRLHKCSWWFTVSTLKADFKKRLYTMSTETGIFLFCDCLFQSSSNLLCWGKEINSDYFHCSGNDVWANYVKIVEIALCFRELTSEQPYPRNSEIIRKHFQITDGKASHFKGIAIYARKMRFLN